MRRLQAGEPLAIGPYRLVGVVGAGGMGRVYLGISPDGRWAAVKQVLSDLAGEPGFRARFAREVEASRRVSGAYTAAVMDADPNAESPWLASVFVPGPSLRTAVDLHGPLPDPTLRRLAAGLTTALTEIHRVGLVHRDFKPGNVLLAEDGPRVIDFGIAQTLHDPVHLTQTGAVIGSLGYMSPEQLQSRTLTPASDVFALGAVLAYAAGGVEPFGTGNVQQMLYRVAVDDPDLSRVPPGLRTVLEACLAKRPEQRPSTEQLSSWIGRLEPADVWLPAPVQAMVHEHGRAARELAGLTAPHPAEGARPADITAPRDHLPPTPAPTGHPPVPRTRQPRRMLRVLLTVATVVALTATALWYLLAPTGGAQLSPEQAAELVTQVLDVRRTPPPGFMVTDDPATPELDGADDDPLEFDRSRTFYACDIRADPPVPAEAGILAITGVDLQEPVNPATGRFPDHHSFAVAYLDTGSRSRLVTEIRARIGDCQTDAPAGVTDWRFTSTAVPGAEEVVGFAFNFPPSPDYPTFQPSVAACDFARAGAVVVRACTIVTTEPPLGNLSNTLSRDSDLRVLNRSSLEPLIARARELQDL